MISLLRLCLLPALALLLPSCMHVRETSLTYVLDPRPATVPGEPRIEGMMDPTGGEGGVSVSAMVYGYASGKRLGPYRFILFATQEDARAQGITVERVHYRTANGLQDTEPGLPVRRDFRPSRTRGFTQAVWSSAGTLGVDFEKEPEVTVDATVLVHRTTGDVRRQVVLKFVRRTTRDTNFYNGGASLIRSIGQPGIPLEEEEVGANRPDWKKLRGA